MAVAQLASSSTDMRFESSQRQLILEHLVSVSLIGRSHIKILNGKVNSAIASVAEDPGSNPINDKFYRAVYCLMFVEKTKIK